MAGISAVNIPIVVTAAGAQPTPPSSLQSTLTSAVLAVDPGYTANLPGLLIEDINSTDLGAVTLLDSARVESINCLSPVTANVFLMQQLGTQVYGVQPGAASNTSVYVVFTGTVGFTVGVGFTVSDGVYQYVVQQAGIVATGGSTSPLYALATQSGTWAVPANSVTQLITSVPSGVTLSVTNPESGTPGATAQDYTLYRSQVLQAGLAASQGMGRYLKTLLGNVPGVQQNLISVRQQDGGGWEVIVGGGDPYEVANAIWQALFDVSSLAPSINEITGITLADTGVVTTTLWNNVVTGTTITISGSANTAFNGTYYATVLTPTTFSLGEISTASGSNTTSQAVINLTAAPNANVIAGATVTDLTTGQSIGTVQSTGATSVTLAANLAHAVNNGDTVLFSVNTTSFGAYTSGGVVTPNARNISVSINDYPDTYTVTFVNPPGQPVTIDLTWNTTATNTVSAAAVSAAGQSALAAYVNNLAVGQPMNLFELQTVFQASIATIIPPPLLTRMVFAVTIDGESVSPSSGTGIIAGDPEGYFTTNIGAITITQG